MLVILFWSAILLILYTFILFPAWVLLRGLLFRRPYQRGDVTPPVSLVIAAYNEAATIGAKLENILSLDYPRDMLEVIIASDGSTDDTDDIVHSYADRGIQLLSLPRSGKNVALTAAAQAATGEILVFSDANSIYATDAIRALVRPFFDAKVGGVAGNQLYLSSRRTAPKSAGERSYWDFDRKLKQYQSLAGNVTSATGSIYAIRRSLFQPIPLGLVDDFMTTTGVIVQGYRLVFVEDAVSYEAVANSRQLEFSRKVRITLQGLKSVILRRELLNPVQHGLYAIQLFSHKVLRRLVVFPLLILLFVSPFLWNRGVLYQFATLAQIGLYGCALVGLVFEGKRIGQLKIFTIPFYFTMVYVAALVAVVKLLQGKEINRWETPGRETAVEA